MNYEKCKVYFDGSHHPIAIGKDDVPVKRKTSYPRREKSEAAKKFDAVYRESLSKPKKERKEVILDAFKEDFETPKEREAFLEAHTERMTENLIKRRIRLMRKACLQMKWDYFCTFTYDNDLHDEESFRKSLSNTLKHMVARKGWKYIGVWERSPKTGRLHFHGLFYTPEMIGEFEEVRDYSTTEHRMQTTLQNTHFLKHFGRNDFRPIVAKQEIAQDIHYIMKYIEKSGERVVYGGKLPTYIVADILDRDRVCPYGVDDRKSLLFDSFACITDGEYLGQADDPGILEKMPKCN